MLTYALFSFKEAHMSCRKKASLFKSLMVAGFLGFGSFLDAAEVASVEPAISLNVNEALLQARAQLVQHQQRTQQHHKAFLGVQTCAGVFRAAGTLSYLLHKDNFFNPFELSFMKRALSSALLPAGISTVLTGKISLHEHKPLLGMTHLIPSLLQIGGAGLVLRQTKQAISLKNIQPEGLPLASLETQEALTPTATLIKKYNTHLKTLKTYQSLNTAFLLAIKILTWVPQLIAFLILDKYGPSSDSENSWSKYELAANGLISLTGDAVETALSYWNHRHTQATCQKMIEEIDQYLAANSTAAGARV